MKPAISLPVGSTFQKARSNVARSSQDDDDNYFTKDNDGTKNVSDAKEKKKGLSDTEKKIRDATFAVSMLFSYTMTFVGTALSFGLVLNLCGYAYIFGENGLEIDKIEKMRLKQQFRAAEIQLMKSENPGKSLPEQ